MISVDVGSAANIRSSMKESETELVNIIIEDIVGEHTKANVGRKSAGTEMLVVQEFGILSMDA